MLGSSLFLLSGIDSSTLVISDLSLIITPPFAMLFTFSTLSRNAGTTYVTVRKLWIWKWHFQQNRPVRVVIYECGCLLRFIVPIAVEEEVVVFMNVGVALVPGCYRARCRFC